MIKVKYSYVFVSAVDYSVKIMIQLTKRWTFQKRTDLGNEHLLKFTGGQVSGEALCIGYHSFYTNSLEFNVV